MQLELQQRLNESSEVIKASEGMTENERLFVALREAEAICKSAGEYRDSLKADVRKLLDDGEIVGNAELGYYTWQDRSTTTFDWKKAAMSGLFTEKQAEPFLKVSPSKALVLKKAEST